MDASPAMKDYFALIEKNVQSTFKIAQKARQKGLDNTKEVSIPLCKNMSQRVVGLISVVCKDISNHDIPGRILELEKEYGQLDWRVGFKIAEEVAKQKFMKFEDNKEAIEVGIRVGFAYLTLGIVSAPLEGFIGINIKKRRDGKEYFALKYAGPIRGAGGTAASTSVILSDYVRVKMGYAAWDPSEKEINRYITDVMDYHDRVTNLQYRPSHEELKFMVSKIAVEVDGDPTERIEVSNYKDLDRIESNLIRGGVALVLAEGLCQKAPKLWKRLSKWGKEFDLEWEWLADFLKLKEEIHAKHNTNLDNKKEAKKTVKANNTFIMDLVAGRPILTHPLCEGGFRLRYGRNRTSGFSAVATNNNTLLVLEKYIAIGTQLKVERPGKACTITICDTLEGPIVRLQDGSVVQLQHQSDEELKVLVKQVDEVLFLGDILINYGDFSENGHSLVPAGYCSEWWALEVEKALKNMFDGNIYEKGCKIFDIEIERLTQLINEPLFFSPELSEMLNFCSKLKVPLHPDYIFYWSLISGQDILLLKKWFTIGKVKRDGQGIEKIILPYYQSEELHQQGKKILEKLGTQHQVVNKENIVIPRKEATIFAFSFKFENQQGLESIKLDPESVKDKSGLEIINFLSEFTIKDKAGTFIGARMGRPEKAKQRHLTGSPQVMFPVGEEGDRLRSFQSAMKAGKIRSSFPLFFCVPCDKEMIYTHCEECNKACEQRYFCRFCGDLDKETCRHGQANTFKIKDIDIKYYLDKAKKRIGEKIIPDLIKGVRGTSNKNHVVEHLSKGLLRAKHRIYVNKEGTTRYDCTELPLTHFKPKEIRASIEKLTELGYTHDIKGNELVDNNQMLELKPQDIILPGFGSLEESGPKVMSRVANYVDDLLKKFYKMKPFYNIKKEEDLIGHLVIGLAPHISAGMVGRIIGFSETQGLLTHPMYHAGLRRDCDGDEAAIMLLMDAFLNFSREFLPKSRGSTMDSPLVLTSFLDPAEVDDQVHGMDVVWKYPLELYEAALEMKNPWDVKVDGQKIEQLGDRLGTPSQYENIGFTHHVDNFNKGIQCSAYKTLPSMAEKLIGQMEIARKVRAVDMDDVAKLVIQKHFLKDIKGNLRKFSMQQFRCVKCNTKYRRPPLTNKCVECQGKLIFTISHGSVVKYLGPSLLLCEKYDFSPYLKQTLDMIKSQVDLIFGKEKDKQVGLGDFIG
tara:strand:+ start:3204 stop:6788 length:3585 start_codon:yes stop_codon:yes gene_type:complete